MSDFDVPLDSLRQRRSMKWFGRDAAVLPLSVAEMDFKLAPPVEDVILEAVRLGDTGCPVDCGYSEAYFDFARETWGMKRGGQRSRLVADILAGCIQALRVTTKPSDLVAIGTPFYPPFYAALTSEDRRVLFCPEGAAGHLDIPALGEAFERWKPAAFLLCSPQNPTGVVYNRRELEELVDLCNTHRVRLISDEVHAPVVYEPNKFVPLLDVAGSEECFSVFSASKGWNLTGIKAALLIAGEGASRELDAVPPDAAFGASHLGVLAHTAALSFGRDWLRTAVLELHARRDFLGSLLERHLPLCGYRPPESTYLAWLDFRYLLGDGPASDTSTHSGVGTYGYDSGAAGVILEQAMVEVIGGEGFGPAGVGRIRLNFATSETILEEAIMRIAQIDP